MTEKLKDRRELTFRAKLSAQEVSPPPWSVLSAALTTIAMLITLISLGPALASVMLGGPLTSHFWHGSAAKSHLLLSLSWSLGMAFTIAFVLASRRGSDESWRGLRLHWGEVPLSITSLLIGMAIALVVQIFVGLASDMFCPIPELFDFFKIGPTNIISAALLLILLQPIAESLVFQAVVLPSLRWNFGPWIGVLMTSVLFTLMHLSVFSVQNRGVYTDPWYDDVYPFLIGFAFSILKVYTGSTGVVIVARMGAGLIFFLIGHALAGG